MAMTNRDLTMITLSTDLNGSQIDWLVMVLAAHVLSATIPAWSVNQGALALLYLGHLSIHSCHFGACVLNNTRDLGLKSEYI